MFRQQHAVAEHVAGHVPDTHHAEIGVLCVDAHLTEMTLYRHPGSARGDAHFLVVVPRTATGSEGVAQPETVFRRHLVGQVGEGGRSLVRRDHEVGVFIVLGDHIRGADHGPIDAVIGNIQQPANELAVAGLTLLLHLGARHVCADPARHEPALGAHRDDYRVLHLLRLDKAQDFRAEVLQPVGPAQATAGDLTTAQVHALHARRIDVDLVHRYRQWHPGYIRRLQLEGEVGL